MELDLAGKVVAITGGAGGIGRAAAEAFAAEGARVGLVGLNQAGLEEIAQRLREAGGSVVTAIADLGSQEGVEDGIRTVCDAYDGELDVLVNNVGTCYARSFDELNDEDWLTTLQVNFMSCVRACRVA